MNKADAGEQWKMDLLTGKTSASEATDRLLERRADLSNAALLEVLLPMAALRATQLEQGMQSAEPGTRQVAERMINRYMRLPADSAPVMDAHEEAEKLEQASVLTCAVAASWLGKILANDLVGEMEKELDRTVKAYRVQQQEQRIHLTHGAAQGMAR